MEFNSNNNIVKRCIQGMAMEEISKPDEASKLFFQAWNEATNDFEKFLAAHYVARHQIKVSDKLSWLETAMPQVIDNISDDDICYAEKILLPNGKEFDEERKAFIRNFNTIDLQAVPGSGKTT